jgi:hypothetical protein
MNELAAGLVIAARYCRRRGARSSLAGASGSETSGDSR